MIRITQIDSELSIYKKNMVVLFGKSETLDKLVYLFNYFKINVDYYCDNNDHNWNDLYNGVPVISPKQLKYIVEKEKEKNPTCNIVVQMAVDNNECKQMISSIGISKIISKEEAINVLRSTYFYELSKENPQITEQENYSKVREVWSGKMSTHEYINNNFFMNQFNIICTMQKTGDHSLVKTFSNNNVPYYMIWHSPEQLDVKLFKSLNKKVKIITGVRDPISQNLSVIYQKLSSPSALHQNFLLRSLKGDDLFKDGGDAQELFDLMYSNPNEVNPISDIMERFKVAGLDLSENPFDKEKGYAIMKYDNIEVFVYQLEKLDEVAHQASKWIGEGYFDKWERANEASSKWIANSYKQAQKEIKITQEHFDICYDNPWTNHFYSIEDIEKLREKWRPHIR